MFRWPDLVPFAEGDRLDVVIRKSFLSASGTGLVARLSDSELELRADLPRQGLVFPETHITYRYSLAGDDQGGVVEAAWNGERFLDEAARLEPAPQEGGLRVSATFDAGRGVGIAYLIARAGPDALEIRDVRGNPLIAGGRLTMTRGGTA
jgi:hypothetical protein